MKKKFIIFTLCLFFFSIKITGQNCTKPDTIYNYLLQGSSYVKTPFYREILNYNSNKNITLNIEQLYKSHLRKFINDEKVEYTYHSNFPNLYITFMRSDYDTMNNQWVNSFKQNRDFNSNGKIILDQNYTFNKVSQSWIPSFENHFTYDNNGNNTSYIYKPFVSHISSLRNERKIERAFDGNKNEITFTELYWDTISSNWVNRNKTERSFSATNKEVQSIEYRWNKTNSMWENVVLNVKIFNANDLLEWNTQYFWNPTINNWVNYSRYQFIYNSDNTLKTSTSELWDNINNQWDYTFKYEYTYNSIYEKETEIYSEWDKIFIRFNPISKTTNTYHPVNYKINNTLYQIWNKINSSWDNSYKSEYTYNSDDSLIAFEFKTFNRTTNNFEKSDLTTYNYTNSNPIYISEIYRNFDLNLGYYTDAYRTENWCKLANTTVDKINFTKLKIYPNPIIDDKIYHEEKPNSKYTIFTIDGKIIQAGFTNYTNFIILENLKSGVYIIKINNSTTTFIKN